jgi:hypothetical protein
VPALEGGHQLPLSYQKGNIGGASQSKFLDIVESHGTTEGGKREFLWEFGGKKFYLIILG